MSLQGKTVLAVEDDALVLMALQDMLGDLGCAIAGTAMALGPALELASSLTVDLAVLDVNLRGELVTPVAEALARRGVPFVFATGYGADILPVFAARPRVGKPYTRQQLGDAMLRALGS